MKNWQVRIPTALNSWFEETYPMHGAKQWFVQAALETARELHKEGKLEAPLDQMEVVVKRTTDHL